MSWQEISHSSRDSPIAPACSGQAQKPATKRRGLMDPRVFAVEIVPDGNHAFGRPALDRREAAVMNESDPIPRIAL
jgi:hypothetical protein